MPSQPQDEWTYLRPEEFADDDAVERIDQVYDTNAENAALHIVDLDEPPLSGEALDTGQTLAIVPSPDATETQYFDDEEPNSDTDDAGRREPIDGAASIDGQEPDEEPGLDQILASQHYSFDQDGQ